ncbi:MAG: PadR family transcriptional regulator [Gemmatimonadaceae bacterium]|nr:PadR family transcriptional regulator [Gemmatimonadaceae bacterium]
MALGDLEQLVMLALLRLGDDGFGAAVQREIAEQSGRDVTLGAVYTALARLEEKGFVRSHVGDPLPQRGGRRRRLYQVLPDGRTAIADAWRAMQALSRGLRAQLEG